MHALRNTRFTALTLLSALSFALASGAYAQSSLPAEDAVIVTGIYNAPRPNLQAPAAITVLNEDDIARISAVHPAEALNTAAGVNIHRGSGQEHLTAIRSPVLTGGAGAGSFLYLEDGVPLRAAGFANVNGLFEGGTEFARQFEIFKGPGPVEYGSNAVHGLINIQSRPIAGRDQTRLLIGTDGFASLMSTQRLGKFRLSASLAHDSGFREDSGYDQQKFALKFEDSFGAWSVEALTSFNNLNQETAGFIQGDDAFKDPILSASNPNPEAFRDGKSYRAQASFTRAAGDATLSLTPYGRRVELRFLRHFVPGQALEKSAHSSAGLLSAYYTDDLNLGLDLEITRGSVFEFQEAPSRFSFVQGLHYDYRAAALSAAAYGEKRFDLGAGLGLNIGARAEYTHYDYDNRADDGRSGRFIRAADRKDDFFTLTPKVSLTKALGDGSLYARAARGARAPQVTDLYSAQLGQIPGEANSETLDSLEAGYKYDSENFHAQAAAFTMRKSGFFFRNPNGFNVTDGKTAHEGIELSARYSPAPWITFSADATLARHTYNFTLDEGSPANNITAGTRVDSAPTALGTARLRLTPNAQITGEIEWRHVGAYFGPRGFCLWQ